MLFEEYDAVGLKVQDGFKVEIQVTADDGFIFRFGRVVAEPADAYELVTEIELIDYLDDAGGEGDDALAMPWFF